MRILKGYEILAGWFLGVIILILLLLCSCTTTKYVEVPVVHNDTVWQNHTQYDSIYVHDSTFIKEAGDTFYMERWHTKYVLKEKHDTTYISKTDTVPAPYPVEVIKEVPAELSWWQRLKMKVGGAAIILCLLAFAIWVWRTK